MRIGELAALVGVSTRTVRHYHQLGLMPEPERLGNGYRDYRLRDAVLLARVRRLVGLGLALDEVRDVLASDRGRELREVLVALDADLAAEEKAIRARRERLARLLNEADLTPDSAVSPEMAEVLRGLPRGSRFGEFDRDLLALVDTKVGEGEREQFVKMMRPFGEARERIAQIYARMDEIADAPTNDPRIGEIARDLADEVPEDMAALAVGHDLDHRWLDEMPPAQAEVLRQMIGILKGRAG
ncbi:DNA-binding transcriptional MerR regulator [Actinomadura pelletieri DSM 43383]|uniref:DNA-binding transcriptional MerR regulator n=1 Tax=Actinomadura pelletieri DSM 43383 TaxID=1120940 RepID=A0A495QRC9_9ACTN|nr:MerR family transcriptional regulator [Actinomadura pelletieri]RKS76042.1 DNA-binding transcriptional MerR regulator [Actinomadura pelletieri DSM 43383]